MGWLTVKVEKIKILEYSRFFFNFVCTREKVEKNKLPFHVRWGQEIKSKTFSFLFSALL